MLSREEFLLETGISKEIFQDLLSLGWLETTKDDGEYFSDADIVRVRKMERICADFELPVIAGTIIVDLLERINVLEETIQRLKAHTEE